MNTLFTDYCAHCLRAKEQGFKQLPFGRFIEMHAKYMLGTL